MNENRIRTIKQIKIMITLKRYLLTLVALLAMTTGAWAAGTVYNTTVALKDLKVGDVLTDGFKLTTAKGQYIYVKGYKKDGGTAETGDYTQFDAYTATFPGGVTISQSGSNYTPYADGKDANAWIVSDFKDYGSATMLYLDGYTAAPAGPEVTLDDTKTVATMAKMPAYDATVSYELVRDLTQGVAFSGLPEGDGCILKKDGDKYTFATAPTIALEDNISGTAQAITAEGITLSYEKKGEGDTWVAQPDDFDIAIDAVPGTYRVVAKATTGLYDGTLYSPEFTLAEAYDLTLSPATDANLQSVTVAGTAKTADENGVIRGIEPTKKVKITTTGPDYIIRKATVKKTVNTVTITVEDVTLDITGCTTWVDVVAKNSDKIECPGNGVKKKGTSYFLTYKTGDTRVNKTENVKADVEYYWKLGD